MKKNIFFTAFFTNILLFGQQFEISTSGNYISELNGYRYYTTVKVIDMDSYNLISTENANFKIFIEFRATKRSEYNQLLGYGQLKIFRDYGSPTTYTVNYGTKNYNQMIGDYYNLYNYETKKNNIARIQNTEGKSIFTIEDYYMRRTYYYE